MTEVVKGWTEMYTPFDTLLPHLYKSNISRLLYIVNMMLIFIEI